MMLYRPILRCQDSALTMPGDDVSFHPQPASESVEESDLILITFYENAFSCLYLILLDKRSEWQLKMIGRERWRYSHWNVHTDSVAEKSKDPGTGGRTTIYLKTHEGGRSINYICPQGFVHFWRLWGIIHLEKSFPVSNFLVHSPLPAPSKPASLPLSDHSSTGTRPSLHSRNGFLILKTRVIWLGPLR